MRIFGCASLTLVALLSTANASAAVPEYPTDPSRYKVVTASGWVVCEVGHYAPMASGDAHAGEVVREFWTQPFQWPKPLKFQYARYSSNLMLTGQLYERYAGGLAKEHGLSFEYFEQGYCSFHNDLEGAEKAIEQGRREKGGRTFLVVAPPSKELLTQASRALAEELGQPLEEAKEEPAKTDSATKTTAEEKTVEKADPAAQKRAEREAEWQRKQDEYAAALKEQQDKVAEFEREQEEVARKKAEQQATAEKALAEHQAKMAAHEEEERRHEAEMVAYREKEAAAKKLLADFDKRHGLGKPSTDTDANLCVTQPQTSLNDTTKGNTAASIVNGCGQPVDVRICLMTAEKGWNCGTIYGLESQRSWSHSSYGATGPVFSDARTSGSNRPLASPN